MSTRDGAQPLVRKQRIITRETVLWSTAAVLAAGYLLVLGLAPEVIEDLTPASAMDPQSSQGQRAAARLASDVKALRDSVAQVQLDLAKVKTEVAGYGESQKALAQQVATLTKADGAAASQVSAEAAQQPAATAAAVPAPAQDLAPPTPASGQSPEPADATAPAEATAPAATSLQPKVINAESKDPLTLETGSIDPSKTANASAIDFGPAVVKKAPKPVGVQISSGASVDSLRLSWSLLAERHADTLKNLEARVVDKGDATNPIFDLVAGPIKSKAEAQRVCKALAAKNVPCKVSEFTGETL